MTSLPPLDAWLVSEIDYQRLTFEPIGLFRSEQGAKLEMEARASSEGCRIRWERADDARQTGIVVRGDADQRRAYDLHRFSLSD